MYLHSFPALSIPMRELSKTKPVHLWVAQTFGASRTKMLFTVAIPTAMPLIFTGLRISLQAAWTTLCAAEMLAANKGLGYMIQLNRSLARADLIIVGMLDHRFYRNYFCRGSRKNGV